MNNTGLPKNNSEQSYNLINHQPPVKCKFNLCFILGCKLASTNSNNDNYMCYFNLCFIIGCKCNCGKC